MSFLRRHPALVWGLAVTAAFLFFGLVRLGFLDALDLKFYDLMMALRADAQSPSDIVLVEIDDDSLEKLGRWPWPRSLIAEGIDKINAGAPKVIGLNMILSEPEKSKGLGEIDKLRQLFVETNVGATGEAAGAFLAAVDAARERLDDDRRLADSIRAAGNVVLPVYFNQTAAVSDISPDLRNNLSPQAIGRLSNPDGLPTPQANDIVLPIAPLFDAARGIGHINLAYDMDGTARRERLVYEFQGLYVPSYTLRLAALYRNVAPAQIEADLGRTIRLGALEIPTTYLSELMVNFKGPRGAFKRFSIFDVINDKIPPAVFKNKLVLVSAAAAGIINPLSTPIDPTMPLGEFSAHAIWSILSQHFVQQPIWAGSLELGLILLMGLIVTFLLPRLKALHAGIVFCALLLAVGGGAVFGFSSQGLWLRTVYPLLELVLGYIGVVSIAYFLTEARKEKVEGESAETNRMLGLSFQSQGMLDMAFDKLRRVPVDDQMKDILYNLALDYERKRQLNKAAAVFEYIESHDPAFKDVGDRKARLMQASETMVYGDGFLGNAPNGLLTTEGGTRPTLGRYEVLRQLGKGAMGIVYLGQDPRINRTVAIKTFRFTDDLDEEQAEALKQKFFREAESAGTLSHPNIVTIYDAGDEQDLAYIAMEFLEGENLEAYTRQERLLPMRRVIDIAADVADALDYAHQKGIVHRDIKPANIMLLKTGVVKITDFGIARITATSQTQTGVVKGTPEQFSGERVDGRSDTFSLGTMLFQMLTGRLPFHGSSPPALMHCIMNVRHPNPREYNPRVLSPLVKILDHALEKDKAHRYQRAMQMAVHLRQLGKRIDAALAAQKKDHS